MIALINKILEDGNPEQLDNFVCILSDYLCAKHSGSSQKNNLIHFMCDFFRINDKGLEIEFFDGKMHVYLTDKDNNTYDVSLHLEQCGKFICGIYDAVKSNDKESINSFVKEMY